VVLVDQEKEELQKKKKMKKAMSERRLGVVMEQ
jgi:hypothetical protein